MRVISWGGLPAMVGQTELEGGNTSPVLDIDIIGTEESKDFRSFILLVNSALIKTSEVSRLWILV